jgi:chaperonin cofactor prefoldin
MVERVFPAHYQESLKSMERKIGEIDVLKAKCESIDEVKQQIEEVSLKLDLLEKREDHKIAQFREETEEIEEKIIEVIDKKIETIEEEIEHYHTQNEESVEEKLERMKEYLISLIQ